MSELLVPVLIGLLTAANTAAKGIWVRTAVLLLAVGIAQWRGVVIGREKVISAIERAIEESEATARPMEIGESW